MSRIEGVVALMRRYAREGYPKKTRTWSSIKRSKRWPSWWLPRSMSSVSWNWISRPPDIEIRLIPEEFNQVVRGLVQNAIEAVASKGMSGEDRIEGEKLVLEVSDNGPGIPTDS